MGLLEEWAAWKDEGPPYVLKADEDALKALDEGRREGKKRTVTLEDWKLATKDERLSKGGDTRLHLGLIPVPFMGNLREASVYVLMLNPGLSLGHYFEHEVSSFRDALIANLRQERSESVLRFTIMDPQFAWHSGFSYWHQRMGKVIKRLADHKKMSFIKAREELAGKLAVIQLVPYRSATFGRGELLEKPENGGLHSVKLVKDFVRDTVVEERCKEGGALVIVTRKVSDWKECWPEDLRENFKEKEYGDKGGRIICYSSGQARGASLNPYAPLIVEQIERDPDG